MVKSSAAALHFEPVLLLFFLSSPCEVVPLRLNAVCSVRLIIASRSLGLQEQESLQRAEQRCEHLEERLEEMENTLTSVEKGKQVGLRRFTHSGWHAFDPCSHCAAIICSDEGFLCKSCIISSLENIIWMCIVIFYASCFGADVLCFFCCNLWLFLILTSDNKESFIFFKTCKYAFGNIQAKLKSWKL